MRLRLFGTTSLQSESGANVLREPQPKRLALLAYLAVAKRGDLARRDTLLAMFWPDATEKDARRSLNQAVHYLRQLVGDEVLTGGADTLGVDPALLSCDVTEFDDAIRDGRFEQALDLHRGHLMDGVFVSGAAEFEDWLARERDVRARRAAEAAWSLSERATAPSLALDLAARAYALAPDEGGTRRLMSLHDRLGDRPRAIDVYDGFARKLAAEYSAKPAPETQRLIADIRSRATSAPSPVTRGAPIEQHEAAYVATSPARPLRPFPSRRPWRGVAAVVTIAATAVIALVSFTRGGAGAADPRLVAVLPFAYHGSTPHEYFGEGVASLLASSLNNVGGMRTVDPRSLFGAVSRADASVSTIEGARPVASALGAAGVIVGDITESGGRVRISATYSPGGDTPDARVDAEGASEQLFDVVDALADKLIARRTTGAAPTRSAARTTTSLAAWRLFISGDADYRAGHYATAVQSLRRAVDIDSTFALAHFRLANATNWTGESGLTGQSIETAYARRDRLSAIDRAKVEAFRHVLSGRVDSALKAYERLIADDPTDVEALFHIADLRFHYGSSTGTPLASTWEEWSRVIRLDPGFAGALLHAARVAAATRSRERFDSVAILIGRLDVEPDRMAELNVLRAFAFGDHAARVVATRDFGRINAIKRDVYENVTAVTPALADIDDLLMAPMLSRSLLSREAGLMIQRAQIELARGRLNRVRATLDSTAFIDPGHTHEFRAFFATLPLPASNQVTRRAIAAELQAAPRPIYARGVSYRHYLLGTLAIRDGDSSAAARQAAALDTIRSKDRLDSVLAPRLARLLRAEILRAQGKPAEALATLGPASIHPEGLPHIWTHPFAHERFLRAELLAETQDVDGALRWFATFPGPKVYDYMFLNGALLRSAELLERRGDRHQAAAKYEELLALWTESQGMESYIREIRARLDRLR